MTAGPRLLTRVALRNYKSIAACDVSPANLCFLVGRNGAGKSNFLDALRFVSDALRHSMDHALRARGGINDVRRRSGGHPTHFGIRVDVDLGDSHGHYAFTVGSRSPGGYEITREDCLVVPRDGADASRFQVERGNVRKSSLPAGPTAASDRLYLVNASGEPSFRRIHDALSTLAFYNLDPRQMRQPQPPDPGDLLMRDGRNIASVVANLETRAPDAHRLVENYLGKLVPEVSGVTAKTLGARMTLEHGQDVRGARHPWKFEANSMSDGTLRALGLLVAVFQARNHGHEAPGLVGVEEPEATLHPAAAGVLLDGLRDASERRQILVSTHSADLLDDKDVTAESILAVRNKAGDSCIGPLNQTGRSAIGDRLFTAGELLGMDQLDPHHGEEWPEPRQIRLFGAPRPGLAEP